MDDEEEIPTVGFPFDQIGPTGSGVESRRIQDGCETGRHIENGFGRQWGRDENIVGLTEVQDGFQAGRHLIPGAFESGRPRAQDGFEAKRHQINSDQGILRWDGAS